MAFVAFPGSNSPLLREGSRPDCNVFFLSVSKDPLIYLFMHTQSPFKILSECPNGYIGVCECCNEFNFAYKTTLISFQEDELHIFFDWLISGQHLPEHYLPLAHGRSRVFTTPHSNLFLTYSDVEMEEIINLYRQTVLMLDICNVLKDQSNRGT